MWRFSAQLNPAPFHPVKSFAVGSTKLRQWPGRFHFDCTYCKNSTFQNSKKKWKIEECIEIFFFLNFKNLPAGSYLAIIVTKNIIENFLLYIIGKSLSQNEKVKKHFLLKLFYLLCADFGVSFCLFFLFLVSWMTLRDSNFDAFRSIISKAPWFIDFWKKSELTITQSLYKKPN